MLFERRMCNGNGSLHLQEIAAWPLTYRISLISALHCIYQIYVRRGFNKILKVWRFFPGYGESRNSYFNPLMPDGNKKVIHT